MYPTLIYLLLDQKIVTQQKAHEKSLAQNVIKQCKFHESKLTAHNSYIAHIYLCCNIL